MTATPTAAPSTSAALTADRPGTDEDYKVPVLQDDPREADLMPEELDFLFDVRGYRILRNALSSEQLAAINGYIDRSNWQDLEPGTWLGDVETHTYGSKDGINFQNIIEGGDVFEQCIDHPAWVDQVTRYMPEEDGMTLHIDENFINVRAAGGFIPVHSGGSLIRFTSTFRNHAGKWMVGQINVLMALQDIGYGDGCTTIIPGSHKSVTKHPVDAPDDEGKMGWQRGITGADTIGMVQAHLKAGDALMFTDAIMHGSMPRTNPGYRRVMIYRYSPHLMAPRFNYIPSDELLARVTPRQRKMIQPQPPRMRPGRTFSFTPDGGPVG